MASRQYLCKVRVSVCLDAYWSIGVGSAGLAGSTFVKEVLVCV